MPFALTFEVAGDVQLERSFSRFADNVKDLSEAFAEITQDFHQVVETKQFESEGAYGSGGWKPLSDNPEGKGYATWKAKNYPSRPLLVLSGLMKESLLGDNPWSITRIEPLRLEVGTKIPYAIYHQKGTGKMQARPVIDLTEDDKTRFVKLIQKTLVKQAKEAGLL